MEPQLTLPIRLRTTLPRASLVAAVCAAIALSVSTSVGAQPPAEQPMQTDPSFSLAQRRQRGGMSLQQAIDAALRQTPGTVVKAETTSRGGRPVHEIRILADDGRVITRRFNADDGD